MHHLIARRDAAQAAVTAYDGKPFTWGRYDCVRMAAFVARRLGNKVGLLKGGRYGSEEGARLALGRAGYASLEDALDARFARIAPASAWLADIVGCEAKEGDDWPCLMIVVGNGRTLGFHEGRGRILQPIKPLVAWRMRVCV